MMTTASSSYSILDGFRLSLSPHRRKKKPRRAEIRCSFSLSLSLPLASPLSSSSPPILLGRWSWSPPRSPSPALSVHACSCTAGLPSESMLTGAFLSPHVTPPPLHYHHVRACARLRAALRVRQCVCMVAEADARKRERKGPSTPRLCCCSRRRCSSLPTCVGCTRLHTRTRAHSSPSPCC